MKPLNEILSQMVLQNASNMHLTVGSPIRMRIHGKLILANTENLTPENINDLLEEYLTKPRKEKLNNGQ